MYRKLLTLGVAALMAFVVRLPITDAQEPIKGPWLWMIVPTEANRGGAAATDIDSLSEASGTDVTEDLVAAEGADVGETVGEYDWALGALPDDGNINTVVVDIGMTNVTDFNDVTSYSLITLESDLYQRRVPMGVSSDDSIKVWLNGEVVHNNPVNRGRGSFALVNIDDYQDQFEVDLQIGNNLLLVKVSERGGGWGQFVGIDTHVNAIYKPRVTSVEPTKKITTIWANLKAQ